MNCPHCGKPIEITLQKVEFSEADVARFWKHVTKAEDGCWICDAVPSGTYARMHFGGRLWLAHVFSYVLHKGLVPDGKKVCHSCDTPRCVRPDHLEAKSHSANMRDMVARGRNKPMNGTLNHLAKLDAQKVLNIRTSVSNGTATIGQLAELYGTSFQSIYQVARGRVWNEVGGPLLSKREVRHLSVREVVEIRQMVAAGERQVEIASRFGIHQATVSNVARRVKRKDVP